MPTNRLTLCRIEPDAVSTEYECDTALTATVHFAGETNEARWSKDRLYWRLVDSAKSNLFTIDLDAANGLLLTVGLPLYRQQWWTANEEEAYHTQPTRGVPVFDLSPWRQRPPAAPSGNLQRFVECSGPVRLTMRPSEMHLELFPENVRSSVIVGGSLACQFNEADELCGIALRDFVGIARERFVKSMLTDPPLQA